jgi:hypothetical protein
MFNRINSQTTAMKPEAAEELAAQLREFAEDGETYEVRDYQGGRKCIAIIAADGTESFF